MNTSLVVETKSFVWTYILPSICTLGLFTNTLNVVVFSRRKALKNPIYKYFLFHSAAELVYLGACLGYYVVNLDIFQPVHQTWFAKAYEVYCYRYLSSSVAVLLILIELTISIKRLHIITNTTFRFKLEFKVITCGSLLVSMLLLVPYLLTTKIAEQDLHHQRDSNVTADTRTYAIMPDDVKYARVLKGLHSSAMLFRGILAPFLQIILNVKISVNFQKMFKRKKSLLLNGRHLDKSKLLSEP